MTQLSLFSLMPQNRIPASIATDAAMTTAFNLYWQEMTMCEPEITGMTLPILLPDGRKLRVTIELIQQENTTA